MTRLSPLLLPLAAALCLSGCYLSSERDRMDGRDGGDPTNPDGRVPFDGTIPFDGAAFEDGEVPFDGGRDSGPPGPDAEPPVGSPPDPSTCRIEPTIHPFQDPVLKYRWPSGPMAHPSNVHVCAAPVVIDLDPTDDRVEPSIVFTSYPSLRGEERGILRIWNPLDGTTISYPADDADVGVLEPTTNLAAGDITGDGRNEILGMGVFSGTYAFNDRGELIWSSPYPTAIDRGLRWARTIGGAITVADLEGDGSVEVIIGRNVLEGSDGAHRFTGNSSTTRGSNQFLGPISCVADLDGDGTLEVIAGRTAFRYDGSIYWNNTDLADGLCGIGDFYPERPGPEVVHVSQGYVYILDGRTGEVIWDRVIVGRAGTAVGGAPTIADFDGDGRPEIGIAHASRYGVYDIDCLGTGNPSGCAAAGLRWDAEISDASSAGTGSSVFDFNGDGRAEVIYNDEIYFRVYDGLTGRVLFRERNSSRTRTENPVIADVDNDGNANIVFTANAEAFFIRDYWTDPGVEVWGDARGRWVGARRIWNQHAYHPSFVNEDGSIPRNPGQHWEELNAYRQNLREGGDVLAAPDLWGGRGELECIGSGRRARLRVHVQNWGLERVGSGVVVGFYRGRPVEGRRVGEARTTRGLEGFGDGEWVEIEVTLEAEIVDYYAVLDDPEDLPGGVVNECREGNNEVLFWRPSCP